MVQYGEFESIIQEDLGYLKEDHYVVGQRCAVKMASKSTVN